MALLWRLLGVESLVDVYSGGSIAGPKWYDLECVRNDTIRIQ